MLAVIGEPEVRYEYLVLEDHRHSAGRETSEACPAEKHSD